MKKSGVATTRRRCDVACVLILAVGGAMACGQDRETGEREPAETEVAFLDDSAAANAACKPPPSANTRAAFARWANGLRYRNVPRKARLHNFPVPPTGDSVRIEITSPARGRPELARGCVIGRIVSTYRDSAFGFIAGTTYIWADSSSPTSVHLVPDDGASEMVGYTLSAEPMVGEEEPIAPAGVPSKHVCEQCGRTDWCVYPRDDLRVTEPVSPDITMDPG